MNVTVTVSLQFNLHVLWCWQEK